MEIIEFDVILIGSIDPIAFGSRVTVFTQLFQVHAAQSEACRIFRAFGFKFRRSPFVSNTAVFYVTDSICNFAQVMDAVFYDNNGLAARFPELDDFGEVCDTFKIKICRRFIENKNFGVGRRDRSAGDFLFFSARKVENVPSHQMFYVEFLHDAIHTFPDFFRIHPQVFAAKGDFTVGIDVEKLRTRILENGTHIS